MGRRPLAANARIAVPYTKRTPLSLARHAPRAHSHRAHSRAHSPDPPPPPPEQPPTANANGSYVWIPGYWAWDPVCNKFLWVAGVWWGSSPGMAWVPGHWEACAEARRRICGYWAPEGEVAAAESISAGDWLEPYPFEIDFWIEGFWDPKRGDSASASTSGTWKGTPGKTWSTASTSRW